MMANALNIDMSYRVKWSAPTQAQAQLNQATQNDSEVPQLRPQLNQTCPSWAGKVLASSKQKLEVVSSSSK